MHWPGYPCGYPIQNPWLPIANRAIEQMRQLGSDLGLSAAALTRISRSAQRGETIEYSLNESRFGLVDHELAIDDVVTERRPTRRDMD